MTSQNRGLLMEMRAGMAALVSNLAQRSSFPEHTYIPNCSHSEPLSSQIPLAFPAISPPNKKAVRQLRGGPAPAPPCLRGGTGSRRLWVAAALPQRETGGVDVVGSLGRAG